MKRLVFILMLFMTGLIIKAGPEILQTSLPVVRCDALSLKAKHLPTIHSISSYHFYSAGEFITFDRILNSYPASPEFINPEPRYLNKGFRRNLLSGKRFMKQKLPLPHQPQSSVQVPP